MAPAKRNGKFILLVGDGIPDYPLGELDGRTPLEAAATPNMDRVAACRIGRVQTIPGGMEPGSDIANLSLLGYDPRRYHTGRSPLEAASMGVHLAPSEVAFRMNLVTLDFRTADEIIMVSHSSGDIPQTEASKIVAGLEQGLEIPGITIHPGVAYRNLLLWEEGPEMALTIPPHDVLEQNMAAYLNNPADNPAIELMRHSWELLRNHPVNVARREAQLKEANSIWLWGQGRAPSLPLFEERYGLKGGVIAAVDLIKGIGLYAGFEPIHVEGATGYLDTNYLGKGENALKALETLDFMYLHVEAPDEAGHSGSFEEKIRAIEDFDEKVVGTVLEGLERYDDYRVMVVSDHFTPIAKRTHTGEPAPFAWGTKKEIESNPEGRIFSEEAARKSGLVFNVGHELMDAFLETG
jgi:2,3-bisphosphoglycerate-independent phosphoglycerate mutase